MVDTTASGENNGAPFAAADVVRISRFNGTIWENFRVTGADIATFMDATFLTPAEGNAAYDAIGAAAAAIVAHEAAGDPHPQYLTAAEGDALFLTPAEGNAAYAALADAFTTEKAQDAVGAMVDASIVYVDATPLLQRAALTGDVTAAAGSNATAIANDAVTYAKMQNVSAISKLLGRGSAAGAGDVEEITLGTNLTMSGTTLNAASGGGGSGPTTGTAILDFGAFPGSSHASVAVTGQAAIVAGSIVKAWIRPVATADHTADEHMVETLKVFAADIVAGTGFTIHGFNTSELFEKPPNAYGQGGNKANSGTTYAGNGAGAPNDNYNRGTRLYGQWTIAWEWI